MAFKCGLVRVAVAVVVDGGWRVDGGGWRGSTVVLGEIGCGYERGSFKKFDFLKKLLFKWFLRGAGKCWHLLNTL